MASVGLSAGVPSGSSPAAGPARVVVVGGGLAGLSATIEALEQGAHVTLVDKQPSLGGNSAKATSGINGANTWFQQAKAILDTPDKFRMLAGQPPVGRPFLLSGEGHWEGGKALLLALALLDRIACRAETLASGRGLCDESLVQVLASESAGALEWLSSPKGRFNIDLSALAQLGGHSLARTHRVPPTADGRPVPVGFTIIKTLSSYLQSDSLLHSGRLHIRTATRVTALELHDKTKAVRGVRVMKDGDTQDELLSADAVVLTTGGYAYGAASASAIEGKGKGEGEEESLLHRYAPKSTQKLPTTNGPFATGDGVKLGVGIGAEVALMDQVQVHPTAFSGGSDPALVASRNKFLAVDHLGRRFVNELDYRDKVTAAMLHHCTTLGDKDVLCMVEAYVVLNDEAATAFGKPTLQFYASKGLVLEYANAAATPLAHLGPTLEEYSTTAQAGQPDQFGKSSFPVSRWSASEPLYLCPVTPAIHYTMGGLRIDPQARVQWRGGSGDGELGPLPGLYAAGEVTGGLHGANRLGGNSLLECVVFGRIAGAQAARAKDTTNAA